MNNKMGQISGNESKTKGHCLPLVRGSSHPGNGEGEVRMNIRGPGMHRGLQKGARVLQILMGAKDHILGRMKKGNKVKDTFTLC